MRAELEFHQLEMRYERLRVVHPEAERRLLASLAEIGQQAPILVVAQADAGGFVVIDGYKRVRGLRRLGRDTVEAACWPGPEVEALLLARLTQAGERETALEQSWLLTELRERFGLSLEELARRFGHSLSWVSRRLALVKDLPEEIQRRVQAGEIAAHAAAKQLVPLARANRQACLDLVQAAGSARLSSRDWEILCRAWQTGNWITRPRLVEAPLLYLKSYKEAQAHPPAEPVREDNLRGDLEVIGAVARRVRGRLSRGALGRLPFLERDDLAGCLRRAVQDIQAMAQSFEQEMSDAGSGDAGGDSEVAATGT